MKPSKLLTFLLLLPFIFSCQSEEASLLATKRWQINDNFIVDGKLSGNGEFTSLILSNNSLELWQNSSQQQISLWQQDQLLPNTLLLDVSDTAEFILSANDNAVQLWHAESKESLGMVDLSKHLEDAKITQIRFVTAPYRFIIGTNSGDVILADTQNNRYRVNRQHSSDVVKLELSKDNRTLFSGGYDGLVVKWDLTNFSPLAKKSLPFRIVSLAVGDDSHIFISDALNDHIIWDSTNNTVIGKIDHWERFKWFRHALFDPQMRWLVTSTPKTDMYIWRLKDMTEIGSWGVESQGLGSSVLDMKLIGNNKLRTLSTNGVLQDWDLSAFDF